MKKMISMIALVALIPTASFVFAVPHELMRPPTCFLDAWACKVEDKAKTDAALKAVEDEAEKILNPVPEKRGRQPR
ncbi:MAG TPA: hypothetical protein VMC85_24205 [Desulfomonilaceae bacterium]|nr:hypothetical protein [Desulfomonilaceae bacterium]